MLIAPTRRQVLGRAVVTVAGSFSATGAYAFAIEPRFRLSVTRYAPDLPNWTPG